MKAGRKRQTLTEKESIIMHMLWEHGPMFVREMVELYPGATPACQYRGHPRAHP